MSVVVKLAYEGFLDDGFPKAWFWGQRGIQEGRCRFWDDSTVGARVLEDIGSPEDGDPMHLGLWFLHPYVEFDVDTWQNFMSRGENFIIPIGIRTETPENLDYLQRVSFPDNLVDYLREGKAGILFYCVGEWFVNQEHIDRIRRFVENNNLQDVRVGCLMDNLEVLNFGTVKGCQQPVWSIHSQSAGCVVVPKHRKYFDNKREQYLFENRNFRKEKIFTCLNRRFSLVRAYLSGFFQTSRMLREESYCSFSHQGLFEGPEFGQTTYRKLKDWAGEYAESSPYMRAVLNYYLQHYDRRSDLPCLDLPELGDDVHDLISSTYNENLYRRSFVSVVSETVEHGSFKFFSEKMFRPIFALQPFILVGTRGLLQRLRELGYQTFDRWWDESYDDAENMQERLFKVTQVIHSLLTKNKETLFRMTQEMEPTLEHNAKIFAHSTVAKDIILFLKDLQG